jgi:hypothetical protein
VTLTKFQKNSFIAGGNDKPIGRIQEERNKIFKHAYKFYDVTYVSRYCPASGKYEAGDKAKPPTNRSLVHDTSRKLIELDMENACVCICVYAYSRTSTHDYHI